MMYLKIDEDTGAKFAGDVITPEMAVISLMSAPRDAADPRGGQVEGFLREWLDVIPKSVAQVVAWASSAAEAAFMKTLGFVEDGEVFHGGQSMRLVPIHAA